MQVNKNWNLRYQQLIKEEQQKHDNDAQDQRLSLDEHSKLKEASQKLHEQWSQLRKDENELRKMQEEATSGCWLVYEEIDIKLVEVKERELKSSRLAEQYRKEHEKCITIILLWQENSVGVNIHDK